MKGSEVERDHHGNNLALGDLRCSASSFRCVTFLKLIIPDFIFIFCTKIVDNTKYFYNFVCCDHRANIFYIIDYMLYI